MRTPFKNCLFAEYPKGSITQYFGENPALYARMGLKSHNGVDLVAKHGTPMCAVEDGTVVDVKLAEDGYGRHIRFISDKKEKDGLYRVWTYGHCDTISVKVGDTVKEGDIIATMGNTGFVVSDSKGNGFWEFNPFLGTHLHIGLRKVKKDRKGWAYNGSTIKMTVPDYNNGWKGSIDPLPYFASDPRIENLEKQVSLLTKVLELLKLKKSL